MIYNRAAARDFDDLNLIMDKQAKEVLSFIFLLVVIITAIFLHLKTWLLS